MLQIDFLCTLLKMCRENGIHTAVDTAGCVPFTSFERILPYTDLFLYDVKVIDSGKHMEYTGVGNELILSNLKKLLNAGADVWVRIPVVADVNDSLKEMLEIKRFFDQYGKPKKVDLLPYHSLGEAKYEPCGKEPCFFKAPSDERMHQLREIFY